MRYSSGECGFDNDDNPILVFVAVDTMLLLLLLLLFRFVLE